MTQRSIPICVILTIVTCGLYGLYWFICVTDEINEISGHQDDTAGVVALVLTIITCNLYGIYWAYKMGSRIDELNTRAGRLSGNMAIILLLVEIVGLNVINYALIQDSINKWTPQAA